MTPILLSDPDTRVAFLKDAIKCEVTEARNGIYELVLEYPVSGKYFKDIAVEKYIKAKPNIKGKFQLFRIYSVSKPILGTVTVNGEHISYKLSHYPIKTLAPSKTTALAAIDRVLSAANENINGPHKFSAEFCNITTVAQFGAELCSARAALGGIRGSVLDCFGGEYEFDNFKVKLHKSRGVNKGVSIRYGKNMTDMKLTLSVENSYTGIFPYFTDNDKTTTLTEGTIHVDNHSGIDERILTMDFTSYFDDGEEKNETTLRAHVLEYLENNDINAVDGSMTVSMIDLSKSAHSGYVTVFETVSLCDTVKVINTLMDVSVTMKVVKTVYDAIGEKYVSLELGTPSSNFADVIKQTQRTADEALKRASQVPDTSALEQKFQDELDDMTKKITGASGGHVVLNPSKNPQELLLLCDSDKLETARKLYRWNSAGLSFSPNGYNGPYTTAYIGADNKLIINNVTARSISANLIEAGSILSGDGSTYFNLDDNVLVVANYKKGDNPSQGAYEIEMQSGQINFKGATSDGSLGRTAKMRTGYTKNGSVYSGKHFALGYISNVSGTGNDGANSLKFGAFDSITDQFTTLMQLNASEGAVFSADIGGKINVFNKLGHFESNTEHNENAEFVGANDFSVGFKHFSTSKKDTTYAWRQHYFGSYIDVSYRHWTGWQAYSSSGKFMHSLTAMQADYSNDTTVLRFAASDASAYFSVGADSVYFQKDYGAYNKDREMLSLYCDTVFLSNGTASGTNVKERLSDLYTNKASITITGAEQINSETHYATLLRHNKNLTELYNTKASASVTGTTKVNGETHSDQLDKLKYIATTSESSTFFLQFRNYAEAPNGVIGCSNSHNFGFYTDNTHNTYANLYAANINSASSQDFKSNISVANIDALSLVEKSKIYSFNYKRIDNAEEIATNSVGDEPKTYGFIVEKETPTEVISEDGKAVNIYAMASLNWKATQQLLERIKLLEEKHKETT